MKPILKLRQLIVSILRSPAGKTLVFFITCWLLAFAYCKQRYWRDPHSAFFNSDHVYDLQYSALREAQSIASIQDASRPDQIPQRAGPSPELCIVWTTVHRDGKNYIDAGIGSSLEGLTAEERQKLLIHVFFANTDPNVHETWNAPWLRKVVDSAWSYDVDNETMAHLRELEEARNFREKGVFDYVYALEKCYTSSAPYIAVFEGDIILADGWAIKTLHALHKIQDSVLEGGIWWNWIYLRLFYTETSLQWNSDDYWYKNMYLLWFLAISTCYSILLTTRILIRPSRKLLDNYTILAFLIATPAYITLLFMIGKMSLYPPSEVFALNKFGCCSQALIFPRPQVPELVAYLKKEKAGQADMMIEDLADRRNMQRLALGKQMAQHLGLVSSRDNLAINAQSTWAFFFEAYDARQLRREHDDLVKEMFGGEVG